MKEFPLTLQGLKQLTDVYPTPFYLYDEKSIRSNIRSLKEAFSWNKGFKEYFAVKSTPNPHILEIFREEGCGVDCASETELMLADSCSFAGKDIMFTSNVTSVAEFKRAMKLDAIINLDDISHIETLKESAGYTADSQSSQSGKLPELVCFRLNPGGVITYENKSILDYDDYKFGLSAEQLIEGIRILKKCGVKRFGLHSQFGCHRREADYFGENARVLFEKAAIIAKETGIQFEFINLAGGLGIPYHEEEAGADIKAVSQAIKTAYEDVLDPEGIFPVPLYFELGIFMTGPYGYFVSTVLHKKETIKSFLGLDSSTNSFMSPSRYSNYQHITVLGKEKEPCAHLYTVTGSLCENRDRFASDRYLPAVNPGDILVFHDAGAYAYSHANNFNGKLRPTELLLRCDGTIGQIRRAETPRDYFSTLDYPIKIEGL